MNPKVDFYFAKAGRWQHEVALLRGIALGTSLTEELKWGVPCYTLDKSNVVLIHVFKEYCALLFFKGALLQDGDNRLVQQTENVQAARQLRFTSLPQIVGMEPIIKTYIQEAINVEEAGLEVVLKKSTEFEYPEEFKIKTDQDASLQSAFEALSPGRQRAYILYFVAPKQAKTRTARVEKYIPQILEGRGMED